MLFADDIAILCDCRPSLNKAIKTIDKWCLKNKLQLNKQKSNIVFIKAKPRSKKLEKDIPNYIEGIQVKEVAKYLGLYIDNKLNF